MLNDLAEAKRRWTEKRDAETEPTEDQIFNGVKFHVLLAACNERSLQLQSDENSEIAETIYEVINHGLLSQQ